MENTTVTTDLIQFCDFPLSEGMQRSLSEMGFTAPTPIQAQTLPLILSGKDVIGRSNTGTGKTAAFGIPAIESLDPELTGKVQVLILCPTRELAMQAAEEMKKFAKYVPGVKVAAVFGGAPIDRQILQLKGGPSIVIGTPGRVMDHMRRRTLKLANLRMVVLDEADEMLNMGFREDIETILSETPDERQTILFSATMPPAIMNITQQYQHEPVLVEVGSRDAKTAANIEQFYLDCPMGRKMDVLNLLLHQYEPKLSIVFCNTKLMVDELAEYLNAHGFRAAGIHGDMKQSARTQVMTSFKNHRTPILIATDVAARGIDVENVDAVFNYDIPQDIEYYVHRIGRTARAGKEGRAFTLISGRRQFYQIRDIQVMTGATVKPMDIPSAATILESRRTQFLADLTARMDSLSAQSGEMVDQLLAQGCDLRQAACALMDMAYGQQKLDLPEVFSRTPGERRSFEKAGASTGTGNALTGIVMGIGRQQRIAPNFIVGAIADATGLPGKEVGKIEIYDDYTVVQMSGESARVAVDTMTTLKINGHRTTVRLIDSKDSFAKQPRRGGYDRKPGNFDRKPASSRDGGRDFRAAKPRDGRTRDGYKGKDSRGFKTYDR